MWQNCGKDCYQREKVTFFLPGTNQKTLFTKAPTSVSRSTLGSNNTPKFHTCITNGSHIPAVRDADINSTKSPNCFQTPPPFSVFSGLLLGEMFLENSLFIWHNFYSLENAVSVNPKLFANLCWVHWIVLTKPKTLKCFGSVKTKRFILIKTSTFFISILGHLPKAKED